MADILEGKRTISLVDGTGTKVVVGEVEFQPLGAGASYRLAFDDAPFADHFLSMRPFKCVEGPEKYWCHVPYPYDIRRQVTTNDLTDLEYDLLFLWKGATEYGINMWNGVYYKLEAEPSGRLVGVLHELDMNLLSVPPEDGVTRPLKPGDLHDSEPESHWLPRMIIE